MNEELKPCPFCGGKAIFKDVAAYLDKGVCVACSKCTAKSAFRLIDHPQYTGQSLDESTRYTREQAMTIVADLWNRRA